MAGVSPALGTVVVVVGANVVVVVGANVVVVVGANVVVVVGSGADGAEGSAVNGRPAKEGVGMHALTQSTATRPPRMAAARRREWRGVQLDVICTSDGTDDSV
jgi:hypothetical protein